jgi:formylglycine-generating enzyme required for sulfatase activity
MKVSKIFIFSFSIIAAFSLVTLFLLSESFTKQTFSPTAQAQSLVNRFRESTDPVERLVTLAGLFEVPGNEKLAQRLFFSGLSYTDKRALFELKDPQAVAAELITVIQGVYTSPRLVSNEKNNKLLMVMAQQLSELDNVQDQDPVGLQLEITRWVGGRQYYLSNNQYRDALRAYDVAITMNDSNPGTYFDRAIAYAAMGDLKQSVHDLARVVTLDPEWSDLVRQTLVNDPQLYSTWAKEREFSSILANTTPKSNSTPTPATSSPMSTTIPTRATTFPALSNKTTATITPATLTSSSPVSQPTVSFTPVPPTCPSGTVFISLEEFCLDTQEVTNAAYQECVESGRCAPPAYSRSLTRKNYFGSPEFKNFPVVQVTWNDAQTYCKYIGRELPQAKQWEQARRSLASSMFSTKAEDTQQVRSSAADKSADGVYDLMGNVKEWVADPDGIAKLVKGDSFSSLPSDPKSYLPDQSAWDIGFRCVTDPN